jgi:hypothetical protein
MDGVTMKDIRKYLVLKDVLEKKIKGEQAARLLGYTKVHISRLKKRLQKGGFEGLLRPKKPSSKKTPVSQREKIVRLYEKTYYDFNIMHFKDKLQEIHSIKLSYETIRKILIEYNIHKSKKKKKVYRRRRRMPKAGLLIQMDSSQHNWIPFIEQKWWLTAAIDDATSEVTYAKLYLTDGVFNNMEVIRKTIENKGLFYALYVDKASHFKTTRYGGLHVNVAPEQEDTHIERALDELNIRLILANSPQAKGRIERLFGTFQDRFVKELRLRGIKDYRQANKYLQEEFIPYYNRRFAHREGIESAYTLLPTGSNLALIFSKRFERIVNFDNTIKFQGDIIQIPPSKHRISFAKCVVEICLISSGEIYVLYKGNILYKAKLSGSSKSYKRSKEIENFLNQRKYEKVST